VTLHGLHASERHIGGAFIHARVWPRQVSSTNNFDTIGFAVVIGGPVLLLLSHFLLHQLFEFRSPVHSDVTNLRLVTLVHSGLDAVLVGLAYACELVEFGKHIEGGLSTVVALLGLVASERSRVGACRGTGEGDLLSVTEDFKVGVSVAVIGSSPCLSIDHFLFFVVILFLVVFVLLVVFLHWLAFAFHQFHHAGFLAEGGISTVVTLHGLHASERHIGGAFIHARVWPRQVSSTNNFDTIGFAVVIGGPVLLLLSHFLLHQLFEFRSPVHSDVTNLRLVTLVHSGLDAVLVGLAYGCELVEFGKLIEGGGSTVVALLGLVASVRSRVGAGRGTGEGDLLSVTEDFKVDASDAVMGSSPFLAIGFLFLHIVLLFLLLLSLLLLLLLLLIFLVLLVVILFVATLFVATLFVSTLFVAALFVATFFVSTLVLTIFVLLL